MHASHAVVGRRELEVAALEPRRLALSDTRLIDRVAFVTRELGEPVGADLAGSRNKPLGRLTQCFGRHGRGRVTEPTSNGVRRLDAELSPTHGVGHSSKPGPCGLVGGRRGEKRADLHECAGVAAGLARDSLNQFFAGAGARALRQTGVPELAARAPRDFG